MPHKGLTEHFPPLSSHEAQTEANRCLYCFDAPCTHACPTHIDVPAFIKKIATGNLSGSARTIFDSNLLGATCSRVCPVEELCEGACVLNPKPISIGRLQRYAMDYVYRHQRFPRIAPPTAKKIAVIGAGPAGLSCAGELAQLGHAVTIFEKREMAGGLSTYGIIGLREPIEVAQAEVRMIEKLGVRIETNANVILDEVRQNFDAVFLSLGLGSTPKLGIPGEDSIIDGLWYIEQSKLDLHSMKAAKSVVVIGAGNTAIDCATIARRLGAEHVTIVYRRSAHEVKAYAHEVDFIRKEGVEFRFHAQPARVVPAGLMCARDGAEFLIHADQIIKAIGQEKPDLPGIERLNGFVRVNADLETSIPGVFAGGDCIRGKGAASTVMAVQDGKLAATAIHRRLNHG
jgi:glutamate synthase (NADPH/NADH) small chain